MSGNACGFVTSSALSAIASPIRRNGERPAMAVNDRAAVTARRVISMLSPGWLDRSALQHRIDALAELLERGLALHHLAVDEERRGRIDLQHFGGEFLVGGDLVEQ